MRADIERAIMRAYPNQRFEPPLANDIQWDWDPDHEQLRALVEELKLLDPALRPSTGSQYQVGEEIIIGEGVLFQISYLGPYAAFRSHPLHKPTEVQSDMIHQLRYYAEKHGFELLDEDVLQQPAPWIEIPGIKATVRACLFEGPVTDHA